MNTLSINKLGAMNSTPLKTNKNNNNSMALKNCEYDSYTPSFKAVNVKKASAITLASLFSLLALFGCKKQSLPEQTTNIEHEITVDSVDNNLINGLSNNFHQLDSILHP